MRELLQCACTAARRSLVTAGVLMLVGWAVGDAKAQDRTNDATAVRERVSVDATAKGNVYFDDFDRDELGDRYSVVDPDPNRITLSGGKLVILGKNPRRNVVLLEERFTGDFVATVMVAMEVAKNNFVGVRYHVDEKNHFLVGIGGGLSGMGVYVPDVPENRNPFFLKLVGGKMNAVASSLGKLGDRNLEGFVPDLETWYLQLRRDGFRYTGFVSADGVHWTRIGSHDMVQFHGQLGLTVGAGSGGQKTRLHLVPFPFSIEVPRAGGTYRSTGAGDG